MRAAATDAGTPLLLGVRITARVRARGAGRAGRVRARRGRARSRAARGRRAGARSPRDEGMRPPVALLAHAVDEPGRAAFWPLAEFSPEWVAIRWALEHGVPVRFIDLPAAHSLACAEGRGTRGADGPAGGAGATGRRTSPADRPRHPAAEASGDERHARHDAVRVDPLAVLAEAAGYDDPERWWEDVVEHRGAGQGDAFAPFAALGEAMGALREAYGDGGTRPGPGPRGVHAAPGARGARGVRGRRSPWCAGPGTCPRCGARTTVAADRALLKGLPKVKAEMTWVPWTHRRLARHSGYGAGIDSPGWYGHLFAAPDRPVDALDDQGRGAAAGRGPARLLRACHRGGPARRDPRRDARPAAAPGSTETTDAVRAVMCEGSDVPLALVQRPARRRRRARRGAGGGARRAAAARPDPAAARAAAQTGGAGAGVGARPAQGDRRGAQPAAAPAAAARRRLGRAAAGRGAARARSGRPGGCAGSRSCPCGSPRRGCGAPPCSAPRRPRPRPDAVAAPRLADVTALAEQCLLAGLPDALPVVMRVLADRAALDTDVGHLAQALPALVRVPALRRRARHRHRRRWRRSRRASPSGSASACRRPAPRSTRTRRRRCGAMWTRCTGGGPAGDADRATRRSGTGCRADPPYRRLPDGAGRRRRAGCGAVLRCSSAAGHACPGSSGAGPRGCSWTTGELAQERGGPAHGARAVARDAARPRRPPGSRGSSGAAPAAGCCWCTTSGCSDWSTPG